MEKRFILFLFIPVRARKILQFLIGFFLIHSGFPSAEAGMANLEPMDLQSMTMNPLITNRRAIEMLIRSPLTSESLSKDPYLSLQFHDPRARSFFRYLYSCAAPARWTVTLLDPITRMVYRFAGGLGLCPTWVTTGGYASKECQELVSACILARSNLFGISVPLSLRGVASGKTFQFSSAVPYPKYKRTNVDIKSLRPCPSSSYGVFRDCGWKVEHVGFCTPGNPVTTGMGCNGGTATGDMMLRICAGIRACDSSTALGANDNTCGTAPRVSFNCPKDGYFGVMKAPHFSNDVSSSGSAGVSSAFSTIYPADERALSVYREGAYYGNMFGAVHISPRVKNVDVGPDGRTLNADQRVEGPVFPNLYGCISSSWADPVAYAKDRFCAGGDTNCLAVYTGLCERVCRSSGPSGFFLDCNDRAAIRWRSPVTVFLNDPCDGGSLGCPKY